MQKVLRMNLDYVLEHLYWIDKIAGGVWIILSVILIYILFKIRVNSNWKTKEFIVGCSLLILIWLYPIYTGFFTNLYLGEIGNIVTLAFTIHFTYILKKDFSKLSKFMIPQTIWLSIAIIYVGMQLLNNK